MAQKDTEEEKKVEVDFRIGGREGVKNDYLVKGITNVGNTCYMGSFLQLLFHSEPFLNELLSTKIVSRPQTRLLEQL